MKHCLYAVKDELAGIFSIPFAAENDAVAVRMFAASARSQNSNIVNTNPEDKALYRICTYCVDTGATEAGVEKIANALQFYRVPVGENKEVANEKFESEKD